MDSIEDLDRREMENTGANAEVADPGFKGGPFQNLAPPSLFTPANNERRDFGCPMDEMGQEEYSLEAVTILRGVPYFVTLNKTPPEFVTESEIRARGGGVRRSLKNSPDVMLATNHEDADIHAPSGRLGSHTRWGDEDPEIHFKRQYPEHVLHQVVEDLKNSLQEEQRIRQQEQMVREEFEREVRQLRGRIRDLETPRLKNPRYPVEDPSSPTPTLAGSNKENLHMTSTPATRDDHPWTPRVTFDTTTGGTRGSSDRTVNATEDALNVGATEQPLGRDESEVGELRRLFESLIAPNTEPRPRAGSTGGHTPPPNTPQREVTTPWAKWPYSPSRIGTGESADLPIRKARGCRDRGVPLGCQAPRPREMSPPTERGRSSGRKAVMEAPKFDGKSELRDYLAQFNIIAELNRWSYEDRGIRLAACMNDEARSVVSSLTYEEATDYDALVSALRCRYEPPGVEASYAAELSTRICRRDETVAAYGWALRKLIHKAYPNERLPDRCECDYFIRGLPNKELRRHVHLARPQTIEEAIAIATAFEAFDIVGEDRNLRKPRTDSESHKIRQVNDKTAKRDNEKKVTSEGEAGNQSGVTLDLLKEMLQDFKAELKAELFPPASETPPGGYGCQNQPGNNHVSPPWGQNQRNGPSLGRPANNGGHNPQWRNNHNTPWGPQSKQNQPPVNANWSKPLCFQCGSDQHLIRNCPHKNRTGSQPLN